MALGTTRRALRTSILYFIDDPVAAGPGKALRYHQDGLLLLEEGQVFAVGDFDTLRQEQAGWLSRVPIESSYRGKLLLPGFIDTHIHFPQMAMIAAFGEQLLTWLNKYTYPAERAFANRVHAEHMAEFFLDELLRNGTTTALVFASVHPTSVEALFSAALKRDMRLIAGKVMMDRNAPDYLRDEAYQSYLQSRALLERWHHQGRLRYAITPRFALTSSPDQLALAGRLHSEFPDCHVHTHLAENQDEIALVKTLFPDSDSYLDVYRRAGLVGRRSLFAHGIHLEERDFSRLHAAGAALCFCPTSNLFLGSGLFRLRQARLANRPVLVGLGTDVGAGTSFSLLQTLSEAYKVVALEQSGTPERQLLSAFEGFYLATLGGARALYLDDRIGSLLPGYEADFVVLDWAATPLQQLRQQAALSRVGTPMERLAERLFVLMMLGDDRNVVATWLHGRPAWPASPAAE